MSTDNAVMIRPGLMVSLKTSVRGGYSYQRIDLDAQNDGEDSVPDSQRKVTRWETTKVVDNAADLAAATKTRNVARQMIAKHCARTSFGMLCPEDREVDLVAAIAAARAMAAEQNAKNGTCHVSIHVLCGRVASNDQEAVRAISDEVRTLVADMTRGIDRLDPEAVRLAATRAREMSAVLAPAQAEKVAEAVKQARKAARTITERIVEGGEDAAIVMMDIQRGAIEKARIAFLDLSDDVSPAPVAPMPAANIQRIAALDLADADDDMLDDAQALNDTMNFVDEG